MLVTRNGTPDFVLVAILLIPPSDQEDPEFPQAPGPQVASFGPGGSAQETGRVFTDVLKRAGTGVWGMAP